MGLPIWQINFRLDHHQSQGEPSARCPPYGQSFAAPAGVGFRTFIDTRLKGFVVAQSAKTDPRGQKPGPDGFTPLLRSMGRYPARNPTETRFCPLQAGLSSQAGESDPDGHVTYLMVVAIAFIAFAVVAANNPARRSRRLIRSPRRREREALPVQSRRERSPS
jgi:hypothetical protein